jgi:hypothetical protein
MEQVNKEMKEAKKKRVVFPVPGQTTLVIKRIP